MVPKLIRLPTVMECSGLSRSLVYLRIKQGLWPKPISLGSRAVAWSEHEVAAINSARIAGKSNEEIKQLVIDIEQKRNG